MIKKTTIFCLIWTLLLSVQGFRLYAQTRVPDSVVDRFIYQEGLVNAHVGISVFNLNTNEKVCSYQSNKKFVPASNLKIITAYSALKILPKELEPFEYIRRKDTLFIFPNADPTFLYGQFPSDKILEVLTDLDLKTIIINTNGWNEKQYGFGWSWDDYNLDFMAEKSIMPIFGNQIYFGYDEQTRKLEVLPKFYDKLGVKVIVDSNLLKKGTFQIERAFNQNIFMLKPSTTVFKKTSIPIITNNIFYTKNALKELLKKNVEFTDKKFLDTLTPKKVLSQTPTISALQAMMRESDNFIAEHLLLMMSKKKFGSFNQSKLIDFLKGGVLNYFPAPITHRDGSGLGRYNLIATNDLMIILKKLYEEYGWETINKIFCTANEGTLKNYFVDYPQMIFAKTGSMSGVSSLSGYFISKKTGQKFAFSIMANGFTESTATIKKLYEGFIIQLIQSL